MKRLTASEKKKNTRKFTAFLTLCLLFLCITVSFPASVRTVSASDRPSIEFTKEEQELIDSGREIVIGCPVDTCPILFADEKTEEIRGITVDILEQISRTTGLKFRFQQLASGSITYDDLQRLNLDLLASVENNSENENSLGIVMTEPYLRTEKIFVCKRGVIFDRNAEMRVAVASGSQTLARVIQGIYPNFQVQFYLSTEDALRAVLSGEADTVLQNQYSLERILAKPQYESLNVVATASIGDSQCLAALVPISEDRQNVVDSFTECLLSILNKGIAALDEDEVAFFIIKETAENAYKMTFSDLFYRFRYACIIIAASFLIIIILLLINSRLQRRKNEELAARKRAEELGKLNEQLRQQDLLLKDALDKAEAGSRAKSSFLFNMSHDIRTPMNAILGFTSIALKHLDDPERVEDSLKKIDISGQHLLQLINEVLDMSRIESGKLTLSEDACDLVNLIERAEDTLRPEMAKKGLTFSTRYEDVTTSRVYCDTLRFNQILLNLLSNAMKFSSASGSVEVSLKEVSSGMEDFASYILRVKDTGIGMSQEFQSRLFQPFERENSSTVSGIQGTGLGMSITKNLLELMDGTIEVESEKGKGTEITLRFVLKKQDMAAASLPEENSSDYDNTDFTGKRILLAEDNLLNREIAVEILTAEGFITETAVDGQAALQKISGSEPGYYDAVLMDIQMPVMDGYEAARRIRALENKELASVPIIAMTANAFEEDRRTAMASGMDAHIAKPIDVRALLKTLKDLIG